MEITQHLMISHMDQLLGIRKITKLMRFMYMIIASPINHIAIHRKSMILKLKISMEGSMNIL